MKRFENDGRPIPNIVFVGDRNECFVLHSNSLVKWLDFEGIDWNRAPSSAGECGKLLAAIAGDEDHPEYQVMNFDCGWYQVKAILKEYMPDELKTFRELVKTLADKMRPMVYELGFLMK